jgi:hypothetical protein
VPSPAEFATVHPGYGLHPGYAAPYPQQPPSSVGDLGRVLTGLLFISAMGQAAQVALTATSGPKELVTVLNLLLFVGIVPVFLVWFYRVRKNAGMWGPQSRSQGWAIGAWFTPVVSAWFPVQIMRDVWRSSSSDRAQQTAVARWTAGWWAFWLLAGVTGFHTSTVRKVGPDGSTLVTHKVGAYLDGTLFSALCLGVAAVLMERVVTKITAMQTGRGVG